MAKYYRIVCLFAILIWGGCAEHGTTERPASNRKTTVAISCDNTREATPYGLPDGTRATIDGSDWTTALWTKNDEVFVWATADAGSSYALRAQRFTLAYFGVSFSSGVFTATVPEMPAGRYTYTGVSPAPAEIAGTQVTYRLPAVQTGRIDGKYDILAATPITGADALPSFDSFQQMTGTAPSLSLSFRHKCHALRIEVPAGRHHWNGARITRLQIDFPVEVVGTVSFDAAHPDEAMSLADGSRSLTLDLSSPLTDEENSYVWAFINPTAVSGDISFTAYSAEGYRSHTLTIPVDKMLEAGHITPVSLTIPEELPVSCLDFSIADYSRLGEEPTAFEVQAPEGMTFRDGTTSKSFTKNPDNRYTVEFYADLYGELLKTQPLTILYESASAVGVRGETPVAFAGAERTEVRLVAPYLFSEDFSRTNYNDAHAEDDGSTGFEMTDANLPGWTGSRWKVDQQSLEFRTWVPASTTVGINTGRVDTPALPIRPNKAVKIKITYKIGATTDASPKPLCTFGLTHKSGALAGGSGRINYPDTQIEEFQLDKNGSPTNLPTSKVYTVDIPEKETTRLTWVGNKASGIATRKTFYFYIDDICVTIVP